MSQKEQCHMGSPNNLISDPDQKIQAPHPSLGRVIFGRPDIGVLCAMAKRSAPDKGTATSKALKPSKPWCDEFMKEGLESLGYLLGSNCTMKKCGSVSILELCVGKGCNPSVPLAALGNVTP